MGCKALVDRLALVLKSVWTASYHHSGLMHTGVLASCVSDLATMLPDSDLLHHIVRSLNRVFVVFN